jgi:hypothetical protein
MVTPVMVAQIRAAGDIPRRPGSPAKLVIENQPSLRVDGPAMGSSKATLQDSDICPVLHG